MLTFWLNSVATKYGVQRLKYIETMSEETKTENTKGNGDLVVVSTRFLPFDSISDLLRKVENIKKAHKIKSETFRQTLKEKGIKFTSIDDYGVVIDIGLLSDEDMRFIKNQDDSFIQKVYDENGVVLNVC